MAIHRTGFGIRERVDIVKIDAASDVVSRRFHRQIIAPEDVDKIEMSRVTHDKVASEETYQRMGDLFGDIIPVRKVGKKVA